MTDFHTFVDLDGVLANFDAYFEQHHGQTPNAVQKAHNGDDAEMWRLIGTIPNFWTELPLMPGAPDLWAAVLPYEPIILTGCPRVEYDLAVAGKRTWVAKHFGPEVPVITCRSKDKPQHMLAAGDILIDDRSRNIKKWEKAGGTVIYFKNATQAIAAFENAVARLTSPGAKDK